MTIETEDVVARLRYWEGDGHPHGLLHREAADTIERLRGLIAELEERVAEDDARWSKITVRARTQNTPDSEKDG